MTLFIILILAVALVCLAAGQIWSSYLIAKDHSFSKYQLHESAINAIQFFGAVLLVGGVLGSLFC